MPIKIRQRNSHVLLKKIVASIPVVGTLDLPVRNLSKRRMQLIRIQLMYPPKVSNKKDIFRGEN